MPSGSVIAATAALLAALAAGALLLDADAVQPVSVAVVVVWALWMVASPGRRAAGSGQVSWPMLLLRVLPIVVAGAIAEALVSDRWFPFTFAALAVALVVPWAAVLGAWQRRRATREDS